MSRILIAITVLLFGITGGGAHADTKEIYKPYAHGFPQIIQEFDYPTIEAIEGLFAELKKSKDGVTCTTTRESIILKQRGGPVGSEIVISISGSGSMAFQTSCTKTAIR